MYIPTPFRRVTAHQARVAITASHVRSMLDALRASFDRLRGLLRDAGGAVHQELGGLAAPLRDGDEVAIVPAFAGGRPS